MVFYFKSVLVFISTLVGMLIILPKLVDIASSWIITKKGSSDKQFTLMDSPDDARKLHNIPKPLVGGLGMIIIVSLSSIIFVPPEDLNLRGYYSAVILLGVVGFLDDFSDLHFSWKFIAQIIASAIMIHYSKTALTTLGHILPFDTIDFGIYLATPVTVICTMGVINSINMIDGLDGLAGGVSLISFISFTILAVLNHQMEMMLLSLALSGAVLGFLKYNWTPAKLFMGDAGSYFIGFSLAFLSIAITQVEGSVVPPVAALLILAVPIADTLTVMIKRMLRGRSPFYADKTHLHHILIRYGFKVRNSVLTILSLSILFSVTAVCGTLLKFSEFYMFMIFITYFAVYFILMFSVKYD